MRAWYWSVKGERNEVVAPDTARSPLETAGAATSRSDRKAVEILDNNGLAQQFTKPFIIVNVIDCFAKLIWNLPEPGFERINYVFSGARHLPFFFRKSFYTGYVRHVELSFD